MDHLCDTLRRGARAEVDAASRKPRVIQNQMSAGQGARLEAAKAAVAIDRSRQAAVSAFYGGASYFGAASNPSSGLTRRTGGGR